MFKPIMGLVMVIDYEINKDYFATYLCENKSRPELDCQGKCFLMQKLNKRMNESSSHAAKQFQQLSKVEIMDIPLLSKIVFSNPHSIRILINSTFGICSGFLFGVFHPPTIY